jgi:hypothetical protein
MWWRASLLLVLGGCAQLFGIDVTSGDADDAPSIDAPAQDAPIDAVPCVGGDARVVDPGTGACYVLFNAPMTRNAARTVCQGLGAGTLLASIQSTAESTLITGLLGASSVFLGGSDDQLEGRFVWEDGTLVQLTNWNAGEPNNGMGAFEEDCIVMHGSLGGKWDDRPCAGMPAPGVPGTYSFVCERN